MHLARWVPLLLLAGCMEPRNIPEVLDAGSDRTAPVVRAVDAGPPPPDDADAALPVPSDGPLTAPPPDGAGPGPAPDGAAPQPPDARPPPDVRPPDVAAPRPPPGVNCGPGTHLCGVACYSDSDPEHCGPSCQRCPPTPNGAPACRQGRCESACEASALACTGLPPACVVPSWGFESGTAEGWALRPSPQNAASPSVVSTARARTGTRALASEVVTDFAREAYVITLERPLCDSGGGVDLGGKTITMYVYFDGPPLNTSVISDPYVFTTEGTSYDPLAAAGQPPVVPQAGQWTRVSAVVPGNLAHIVTRLAFFSNVNVDGWRGTVYLDDITIE